MSKPAKTREVTVFLPDEAFAVYPWEPDEVARELSVLWILELVRQRRVGHAKGAELAGMTRLDFLKLIGEHLMTPFDYDDDELKRELES